MTDLDLQCAKVSERIYVGISGLAEDAKKTAETILTKSLGVLQEDGIYAFFLYLRAKNKPVHNVLEQKIKMILGLLPGDVNVDRPGFEVAGDICEDLDKLLLAKELLERTLVYARYHCKTL